MIKTVVPENTKYNMSFGILKPFGLITRRDLENHYGILK
jgi:hypothetical protein